MNISGWLKKLKGSRYTKSGNCKKCGMCCRNITFKIKNSFITEEAEFERLKRWQPRYNHFSISGRDENGIILFTCKSLGEDNLCKSYWLRSWYCRSYPKLNNDYIAAGEETPDGCGYYFTCSVKFEDFLSKKHKKINIE